MRSIVTILFLCSSLYGFSQSRRSPELPIQLIVYGINDCHYCHDTKELLDEKEIPYVFYDVDKNTSKQQEMIQGLKRAGKDLKNLNMPVVKKSGTYLLNDGDFDKFLNSLILLATTDVSKG